MLPPFDLYQPQTLRDALRTMVKNGTMPTFSGGTRIFRFTADARESAGCDQWEKAN